MAGVWVALEDMDMDNGPLVYYPGQPEAARGDDAGRRREADHSEYRIYERYIAD